MTNRIIIICEGDSEVAYLRQLQRFLDSENDKRPLAFFPKSAENGCFKSVMRTWRKVKEIIRWRKKKPRCAIWVDYDLYYRNTGWCMTKYRRSRFKALYFSFYNFEDFLILHYPDDTVKRWKTLFAPTRHFKKPLHSDEHLRQFKRLFPNYKKGEIPFSVFSWTSLTRLKANLKNRIISPPRGSARNDFATLLIATLEAAYPDRMAPWISRRQPAPYDESSVCGC